MKIVHFEDVAFKERLPRHRDGRFEYKALVEGTPGTPGNFILQAVRTYGDFFSPRHRHNFDQFRFQLEGMFDFGGNSKMTTGSIAYFPEGTFYGPQSSSEDSLTIVLQFGGASGSGYISKEEFLGGSADLQKVGQFQKGAFTQVENGQKRNKDGYQAVWEHIKKRPLEYPAVRYHDPIFMNPRGFAWVPVADEPGLFEKRLGVFTERETTASFLRLEPMARARLRQQSLYFIIKGRGHIADVSVDPRTTIYLEPDENAEVVANEETEILHLGLPDMSGLANADVMPARAS